jgi:hypothetical protein
MGCDIHMIVQKRETLDAPWVTVREGFCHCDDCDGVGKRTYEHDQTKQPVTEDCYWCKGSGKVTSYNGRNYDLFAQLADVRNGSGCAGIDTGDGFIPIAERRGLPEGMSEWPDGEDEEGDNVWLGDHSHSWLTLAELLAYDTERGTVCRGVVSRAEFEAWDGASAPASYCGDISGPSVVKVSAKAARQGAPGTHVKISWTETYRQAGGRFWSKYVPALQTLGAPDCVRV